MTRILTLIAAFGVAQTLIAQTLIIHVNWPDGTPVTEISCTANLRFIDSGGHVFGAYSLPVENGVASSNVTFPLFDVTALISISPGDVNARERVTILDLVRMQKHLLEIQPFTHALQIIAGDANQSQSITALDLITIRKVILGLYQQFPSKPEVQFFVRETTDPPPIGTALDEVLTISYNPSPGPIEVNFWAVKSGDVYY